MAERDWNFGTSIFFKGKQGFRPLGIGWHLPSAKTSFPKLCFFLDQQKSVEKNRVDVSMTNVTFSLQVHLMGLFGMLKS